MRIEVIVRWSRAVVALLGITASLSSAHAQSLQVSGGLDARVTNGRENPNETGPFEPQLTGAFFNLRKVWSDDFGDRWIGVAQADFDDNFRRITPYQLYLQYKGPLGKWNVRAGHYLLPFGLLATYDTERLILQGLEKTSLGIRKDTGMEAFGRYGSWDYAVSMSDGLSDQRFISSQANPVITARLAYVLQGDAQIGVSTLVGRVLQNPDFGFGNGDVQERRLALDATKSFGPLTVRAEAVAGTNAGRSVGGGVLLGDYALTPKLELNTRYAYWSQQNARHEPGIGLTYQLRQGLFLRAGDTYQSGREHANVFTVQLYYEFSKLL